MNFARFNHILVPQRANERLSWLNSKRGRFLSWSFRLFLALSPLGRALLVFGLFAGAFGLNVEDTVCYMLWSVTTGVLVASLLIRKKYALENVTLKAVAPKRVKVGAECRVIVQLNNGKIPYRAVAVQSPFLTWDGRYLRLPEHIAMLEPNCITTVNAILRFEARGVHSLTPFSIARTVPLGVAVGPVVESNIVEFVVVPNYPKIVSLSLLSEVKCQPQGIPLASKMGEAQELAGVRPYQPGDRVRDLHAATWARTGVPHVRQYQQEYFSRIGLILDVAATNASEKEFEAAVSLTAGILAHLAGHEALVDVLCVGNQFHELTIGRSIGFFEQGLDLLATVTPGDTLVPEVVERRLGARMDSLSSLVIVCLRAQGAVSTVCKWSEQRGVPVSCYKVATEKKRTTESFVTHVSVEQVNSAKELQL